MKARDRRRQKTKRRRDMVRYWERRIEKTISETVEAIEAIDRELMDKCATETWDEMMGERCIS